MLPSIEVCLPEGTAGGEGVRSCILRFVEEVVCKLESDVGRGEGGGFTLVKAIEKRETQKR